MRRLFAALLFLSVPAAAETFTVTMQVVCPASLQPAPSPDGGTADAGLELDPTFSVPFTRVPCAGLKVTAMDSDFGWDEYCGAAFTDSQGRVSFAAECSDGLTGGAPDVYVKVEGRSMFGFSVGTHDYGLWDGIVDGAVIAGLGPLSIGTLPSHAVDYLRSHETYAWLSEERAPTDTAFGTRTLGNGFDREGAISNFAARQLWAAEYAQQVLRATTAYKLMDFNYTVDAPLGTPMTVWDTVLVNEDRATDALGANNRASAALAATPHEMGHVLHNGLHSGFAHWLYLDVIDLMTDHQYDERHNPYLAWYEGFGNWVQHVAYARFNWGTNTLRLPDTHRAATRPGFDIEGNVTHALVATYFGPVTPRPVIDYRTFTCAPGLGRVVDALGVVRCEQVTAPRCAASRTLTVRADRDICVSPDFIPVDAATLAQWRATCRADGIAPERCFTRFEAYVFSSCPAPSVAVVKVGRDDCVTTVRPQVSAPGGAPLPRGDGTPDRVLATDGVAPASAAGRWYPLASADTIIGWVAAAGDGSHAFETLWSTQARPWCIGAGADGYPRFCNAPLSPEFVSQVAPSMAPSALFP
ncbi:MAG: hypothetical protein JNK82_35825 [Myxococcaceae bacterium]|nr:hypothetical protein [Myxococcaceae bacterium]